MMMKQFKKEAEEGYLIFQQESGLLCSIGTGLQHAHMLINNTSLCYL
jgi:hypothetical protein